MTRIVVTAGTGANPFPWPKGTTNVTSDANGNIVQLWGRNVDDGTIWKVAHEFNYEQQLTRILLNNGDTVMNTYDGTGYRLKEVTTSGGTPTEKRLIPNVGNRVIQERDSSDAVTARYYWEDGVFFKNDHGTSTKYFVPETRNSPFTGWNNTGTFNRYDWWDTFGVKSDESSSGSLSPFQLACNMLIDTSHLTLGWDDTALYPQIGQAAKGFFKLTFIRICLGPGGGDNPCCGGICCYETDKGETAQDCARWWVDHCTEPEDILCPAMAFGPCKRGFCDKPWEDPCEDPNIRSRAFTCQCTCFLFGLGCFITCMLWCLRTCQPFCIVPWSPACLACVAACTAYCAYTGRACWLLCREVYDCHEIPERCLRAVKCN
jgi:hypothetical protein